MEENFSLKNIPKNDFVKICDIIYNSSTCQSPEAFTILLKNLLNIFPADAIVCGYGSLSDLKISGLVNINYPEKFLKHFLKENHIARSGLFFEWMRSQKPELWIDVYKKHGHSFDPTTREGFDSRYVELVFDYKVDLTVWSGQMMNSNQVSSFCMNFHSQKEANQFSDLYQVFIPYLHRAFVSSLKVKKRDDMQFLPSPRESEILEWLTEGKTNWEIGMILNISRRTVKFHIHNLMKKLNATNRCHLVAQAFSYLQKTSHD